MGVQLKWKEDEKRLYELYRKESNGKIKMRLHSFWQLRQGKTIQAVCEITGCSAASLERWLRWYRHGGIDEIYRRKHGGDHGEKGFLTEIQKEALVKQAAEEGFASATEAGVWIEETFGVHYKTDSVRKLLRRVGLKKKVPRPRSPQMSPQAQKVWKKGGWSKRLAVTT